MATNIYILKLKNNKYYIGKTNDIEKRFLEHMSGNGSLWTQINKPIKIEKVIPNASKYDEDRYVKEYMYKYGIDNVRGGTYVTEELDEIARYSLQKELWGANDCCTQCGRKGHFVKDCKYNTDVNGEDIYEEEVEEVVYKNVYKKNSCHRCGRTGHFINDCYARTDVDGNDIDETDEESD